MKKMNLGGKHIVSAFDEDVLQHYKQFEHMRSRAARMLREAVANLAVGDADVAARIIAEDTELDELQMELEGGVIGTLARRSPVADDLRMIVALIKMASITERVGDHAKNIAKRTNDFDAAPFVKELAMIDQMVDIALKQLRIGAKAFLRRDPERLRKIEDLDVELDELFGKLVDGLIADVATGDGDARAAMHLMFIGKQIERAGDHGVNIGRAARYIATGEHHRAQVAEAA